MGTSGRVFEFDAYIKHSARSTSAAPGFFKPFKKETVNALPELVDGGLFQNNPVQLAIEEARSIAKTGAQVADPDIIVSIGTGLPRMYLDEEYRGPSHMIEQSTSSKPFFQVIYTMISFQVRLNLDSEQKYRQLLDMEAGLKNRMHRINPYLNQEPPRLDDKTCFSNLSNTVRSLVADDHRLRTQLESVACALVASSFHFQLLDLPPEQTSLTQLPGLIKCRLKRDPSDVKGLGKFLEECTDPATFLIQSVPQAGRNREVRIPIAEMVKSGTFQDIRITIEVSGEEVETIIALKLPGRSPKRHILPISGFPRSLIKHDWASRHH